MKTKGAVASLLGLILVAAGSVSLARIDTTPRAVAFKPAKVVDAGWRAAACAAEGGCGEGDAGAALYTAANLPAGQYYAILTPGPSLVVLSADAGQWRVVERWSLAGYSHSDTPTADLGAEPEPLAIHPALYPLGPGDWGVALISQHNEGYSGGGAGFQIADFVSLKAIAASAAQAKPVYGGVPFSCYKTIRACFSEREYKTSPHCHDEYGGSLRIRYAPGQPRHGWTFVWSETDWPAGEKASQATTTTQVIAVAPGQRGAGEAFPFCDGGPVG